jgi:hypothetical protein
MTRQAHMGDVRQILERVGSKPVRIQRCRAKGWRMPHGAVYVGRPTKWGNPYVLKGRSTVVHVDHNGEWWSPDEAPGVAVRLFREDLWSGRLGITVADVRRELAGRDLACWCPPGRACHADVLVQVANEARRGGL